MTSLIVKDVIKRAMRMHGALASGNDPDATESADYLIALNTMKRAMFGTLIGPRLSPQSVTGVAAQAERGGEYEIAAAAPFTLTAPANPRSGSRFGVVDAALNFATFNTTVTAPGRLINGLAANYVMNTNGARQRFWFRGDTGNWVIEADYVTLFDVIEFPDALIAYLPYMLNVVIAGEIGADLRSEAVALAAEGRQLFARVYGARGANVVDSVIGLAPAQPAQAA